MQSITDIGRETFERAVALHRDGKLAEAAVAYEAAAGERLTVNLAENLGLCLLGLGQLREAERWLRLALRHRPENATTELALAETLLSAGRYAEGWRHFEARARAFPSATTRLTGSSPEWMGEPLNGRTIVIVQEQGLGDQIMFARFAPLMKSQGAGRVVLCCQAPLARLFRTLGGVDEVIGLGGGEVVTLPHPFVWVRCMSLAGRLGVTPDNVPSAPYLSAPPRSVRPRIGVFTSGNPENPADGNRSLDEASARRLHGLAGAMSLDPAKTGARDLLDTAEIIAGLDLVLSVDTAVAHLAGAMGKPTWVLLPALSVDWRWQAAVETSPWYPSVRLARQLSPGDWSPAVDAMLAAIA